MTAHKHAALMLQYAQDAAETDRPWELWEAKSCKALLWDNLHSSPGWAGDYDYRRKPEPPKTQTRTFECLAHVSGYLHWREKGAEMVWPEQWSRVPSEDKTVEVVL